ncbi:MAG TPA: crosslink repair DNA glycosylase YcaQ family protein [Myxococcales bacterium]|nr:crosslink repair DNA glycosylase YcaQ family protein [Myxococcales bacterium]
MTARTLSLREARRIALLAQGFGRRRAGATLRKVRGLFDQIALIQVDSVNVLVRSQELPVWARLGPHPRNALPDLCRRGEIFEYWGHEASLMPVDLQPLLRWRMAEAREKAWRSVRAMVHRDPEYVAAVREEVHARGNVTARDLEPRPGSRRSDSWWGWDDRKRALAYLFWAGEITAVRSPNTFERVYAPLDRVLPERVLSAPTPAPDDARRELLLIAARALGIATARDLADYFRISPPVARPLVKGLAASGRLVPASVEGWREPAYLHPDSPRARAVQTRALLSPFDSLIWDRRRTARLFGFDYRIEMYTPQARRRHGYYVLPFLLDEALVARVDLKADRAAGALLVQSAWAENGAPETTARALAAELGDLARWLGLQRVTATRRGGLSRALRLALTSAQP